MLDEKYIEHEVRLRLHDHRFKCLEATIKETRYFTRAILGAIITAIILPIILHHYALV